MFHIDDKSDLRRLEYDLTQAPKRGRFARKDALKYSAQLVEVGMFEDASGHRFLPHLQKSVSWGWFDNQTVEVGLGGRRGTTQGKLAHIIVYGNEKYPGTVLNNPVWDHTDVLRRNREAIDYFFAEKMSDAVLGHASTKLSAALNKVRRAA